MSYELFIALRYLRAKRRQAAVSVITAIAIMGIALGTASLIVAQALITGFRYDVQEKILQGTAHINLIKEDNTGIEDYRQLISRVRQVAGVKSASATIYAPALLSNGDRQEQAILKGIDLQAAGDGSEAREISSTLIDGSLSQLAQPALPAGQLPEDALADKLDGIILGQQLARALGLRTGDDITAVSAQTRLTPTGPQTRPRQTRFHVVGIFSSGLYEYDSKWAYLSLAATQGLGGGADTAGVIQMKVDDIYAVSQIGQQIQRTVGPGFVTTNWQELNRPLFAALELQHRMIIIFFSLLIVIAALNIITTLTMMVIEKHREIAILRTQGALPTSIRKIFLLQGLIIGLIGAGLGLSMGLALSWTANAYRLVSIPAEIYSVSHITLKVQPVDCLGVALLAIIICLLATLFPSQTAARLTPGEALRYE
jgi:lipoprotein-releasing system permease protein